MVTVVLGSARELVRTVVMTWVRALRREARMVTCTREGDVEGTNSGYLYSAIKRRLSQRARHHQPGSLSTQGTHRPKGHHMPAESGNSTVGVTLFFWESNLKKRDRTAGPT